ncbi:MAG TPA: hypothetical protein VK174_00400, partial [Chitinophagales bacterium]|nr:hypothetical protein [Chitinophagales bacterium]
MKKLLFFLLCANVCMAQTDSATVSKPDSVPITIETVNHGVLQKDLNEFTITSTRAGTNSPTAYQIISKEDLNKNNLGQDLP